MTPLESNDFPPRRSKHGVDHMINEMITEPFALSSDPLLAKTESNGYPPAFLVADGAPNLDPMELEDIETVAHHTAHRGRHEARTGVGASEPVAK